jgi:hypothetical protein
LMFEFSRVNDAPKPANSCQGPPVEIELDDFPRFCAINLSNAQSLRTAARAQNNRLSCKISHRLGCPLRTIAA